VRGVGWFCALLLVGWLVHSCGPTNATDQESSATQHTEDEDPRHRAARLNELLAAETPSPPRQAPPGYVYDVNCGVSDDKLHMPIYGLCRGECVGIPTGSSAEVRSYLNNRSLNEHDLIDCRNSPPSGITVWMVIVTGILAGEVCPSDLVYADRGLGGGGGVCLRTYP
jgi:hypothetical protein